jgi:hypothetical protein
LHDGIHYWAAQINGCTVYLSYCSSEPQIFSLTGHLGEKSVQKEVFSMPTGLFDFFAQGHLAYNIKRHVMNPRLHKGQITIPVKSSRKPGVRKVEKTRFFRQGICLLEEFNN